MSPFGLNQQECLANRGVGVLGGHLETTGCMFVVCVLLCFWMWDAAARQGEVFTGVLSLVLCRTPTASQATAGCRDEIRDQSRATVAPIPEVEVHTVF